MNIFVGGVNGVGKSTILRKVANLDSRFEVIHYASALMQQLGLAPGDYDSLHTIPQAKRLAVTQQMMENLAERRTQKVRLIDGHYLILVKGVISPIAGDWVKLLDALILIKAAPQVILDRIQKDEGWRDRELFTPEMSDQDCQALLADYGRQTEAEFDQLTQQFPIDHFILEHSDDDVERAAHQIINFANQLLA
ncbi:MAG TPA: ATP-binding protein [Candidatus Saccharimonadales bacterium]|nr:ATP-binding protein [Candidatus Saccharimonadales bacterium]